MYSKLRYVSLIVCLVTAVALSACAADRASRSTGQVLDDHAIAAKVKTAVIADPEVKGTQVGIEVHKGVVQLSGFVDTQQESDRAVQLSRTIKGVKAVNNSLIIK